MYFIYTLKMNGIPFYIGKSLNPINRYTGHVHNSTLVIDDFCNYHYQKYNQVPEMELLMATKTNKDALRLEYYFASMFISQNIMLLNYHFNSGKSLDYRQRSVFKYKKLSYNQYIKDYYSHNGRRQKFNQQREKIQKQINYLCKK